MQDAGHQVALHGCEEGMNMVWHDDPGMESVTIPIKVEESLLNGFGNRGMFKERFSSSLIEIGFNPFTPFNFGLFRRHELQFLFPLLKQLGGERICKTECHQLRDFTAVKVR